MHELRALRVGRNGLPAQEHQPRLGCLATALDACFACVAQALRNAGGPKRQDAGLLRFPGDLPLGGNSCPRELRQETRPLRL